MKAHALKLAVVTLVIAGVFSMLQLGGESPPEPKPKVPILGNVQKLRDVYARWKAENAKNGGGRRITLPLRWSKGRSAEFTNAFGEATFDLADGVISVKVNGFPAQEALDVWLVEYRPGAQDGLIREADERLVRVGGLTHKAGTAILQAPIAGELLGEFELDLVVVSRAGKSPADGGLLYGTPDLFQRIYSSEYRAARNGSQRGKRSPARGLLLAVAAPTPAVAAPEIASDTDDILYDLVVEGEDLFFNEQFDGNGRTCGTCHPAENNLTIDPDFIATLPADDPLFVAEFIPELAENFEKPVLMREFGLILENNDGFDNLATNFNMRGVPHVFAQNLSLTPQPFPPGGSSTTPPNDRTGWSGDGAPNDGALRDFATGAVNQHFPLTTNRLIGVDFRLPTPDELTAIEAFMRSLGRQVDPDISSILFTDSEVIAGRDAFISVGCAACHFNAGANVSFIPGGFNFNFNTGVEAFLTNNPDGTGEPRPPDGGFGTNPAGDFTSLVPNTDPKRVVGSFGNGEFNTPSIVEAADTPPFFHNNITATSHLTDTIEGAVDFYNTAEFNASPGAGPVGGIRMSATVVEQIGKFLRVMNALENERSARDFCERALDAFPPSSSPQGGNPHHHVNRLLRVAIADINDAIEVLGDVALYEEAIDHFEEAEHLLQDAITIRPWKRREAKIEEAIGYLEDAREEMME